MWDAIGMRAGARIEHRLVFKIDALFRPSIGLFHNGGVVDAEESDRRLDAAFDADFGTLTGDAANIG